RGKRDRPRSEQMRVHVGPRPMQTASHDLANALQQVARRTLRRAPQASDELLQRHVIDQLSALRELAGETITCTRVGPHGSPVRRIRSYRWAAGCVSRNATASGPLRERPMKHSYSAG